MPIKSVNQDVANAINNLVEVLKRNYKTDFAYSILGNGCVLAQSNINGVNHPIPHVLPKTPDEIVKENRAEYGVYS